MNDKSGFRNLVELEEERLVRQLELNRLAGEKESEVKILRKQAGRK